MRMGMLLLGLGATAGLLTAGAAGQEAQDEAAVRQVVRNYLDARERRDPAAVRALFTEDADQLVSSGEWRSGREAIVRGVLASSAERSGARTIEIERVRFPARDVALADGRYEIAGTGGAADRRMWTAFVLVRSSAGWRIAAIRNMLPAVP